VVYDTARIFDGWSTECIFDGRSTECILDGWSTECILAVGAADRQRKRIDVLKDEK
jgi:hypothetical protein